MHPFTEGSLAWPGNGSPTMYATMYVLIDQTIKAGEIFKQCDNVVYRVLNGKYIRLSSLLSAHD